MVDVKLPLSTPVIPAFGNPKQEHGRTSRGKPVWAQSETRERREKGEGEGRQKGRGKIGGARRAEEGEDGGVKGRGGEE